MNLQGDNPLMPCENINQIAQMMNECDIATLSAPLRENEIMDPNVVKVLSDPINNAAISYEIAALLIGSDKTLTTFGSMISFSLRGAESVAMSHSFII